MAGSSDWEVELLRNGCINLYCNPFLMETHSNALVAMGWKYQEVYEAESGVVDEFFEQISSRLNFPGYFGRNLDALWDCITDIEFPESGKLALGLLRFDLLATKDPTTAYGILDIFADVERGCLMRGQRILFLVQSGDPNLAFEKVGGQAVNWNFEERLNSKRLGT